MPFIIENLCPDVELSVHILYIGGVALNTHRQYMEKHLPFFTLDSYTSSKAKWKCQKKVSADSVIPLCQWDCVILQDGSIAARRYETIVDNIVPIKNYIELLQQNVPFAFMINPSHPNGSSTLGNFTSEEEFIMYATASKELQEGRIVDYVIPCGTAIQNAKNTYLDKLGNFGNLSYEGKHLQEGIPCWIEAYTAAKFLIDQYRLSEKSDQVHMKVTQKWVIDKNIPGRHGVVIDGRDTDYRLSMLCALKAINNPFVSEISTINEIFPSIFKQDRFILEAHRGFSYEFPENTTLAFEKAGMSSFFDAIETDVRQTKDGFLVCMHDSTINRTTTGSGVVSSLTLAELENYFINGGSGWNDKYENQLKVPTFAEFLAICKKYDKVPYIELKSLSNDGIASVIKTLHDSGFADGTYVLTSFSLNSLKYASAICDAPLEYMNEELTNKDISKYCKIRNIVMRPPSKQITKTYVEQCYEKGLIVECYSITVGDEDHLKSLKSMGVYGGTCNSIRYLY